MKFSHLSNAGLVNVPNDDSILPNYEFMLHKCSALKHILPGVWKNQNEPFRAHQTISRIFEIVANLYIGSLLKQNNLLGPLDVLNISPHATRLAGGQVVIQEGNLSLLRANGILALKKPGPGTPQPLVMTESSFSVKSVGSKLESYLKRAELLEKILQSNESPYRGVTIIALIRQEQYNTLGAEDYASKKVAEFLELGHLIAASPFTDEELAEITVDVLARNHIIAEGKRAAAEFLQQFALEQTEKRKRRGGEA